MYVIELTCVMYYKDYDLQITVNFSEHAKGQLGGCFKINANCVLRNVVSSGKKGHMAGS